MRNTSWILFLPFALAVQSWAADVRLERVEDFEADRHSIGVNLEVRVKGGCLPDDANLATIYESLLSTLGFSVRPMEQAHLEFAVSIIGFPSSDREGCGIRVITMARQIPEINVLRLSPSSTSAQFRLWVTETVVTGLTDEMPRLLQAQAQADVIEFYNSWRASKD